MAITVMSGAFGSPSEKSGYSSPPFLASGISESGGGSRTT